MESEIRAQFEAFGKTGLPLDHVNAHNHLQLHPTVLNLILKAGCEHGMKAIRLPFEPPLLSWRASRRSLASRLATGLFLRPWIAHMRSRLTRARLHSNDYVFGLLDSGAMTAERTIQILSRLPEGVTEIYFHPATRRCPEIERALPGYWHEQEFAALINPAVKHALEKLGVRRIAFSDL